MKSARILAFSAFAIRTVRALAAVEPGATRRGRGHAVRPRPHRPRTDHPTDYPTYAPTYFPTGDGGDGTTARPTDAPSTDDSEDGPCPLCSYAIASAAPPGSGPVEGVPVENVPVITTTTTVATTATTETTATEATTVTTAGAVGAETSPEYDAFDFNNLGPFGAVDRREDPTQENPADKKEVDPVNGLEFRPTPVVEAMANGASSNDFAIVVAFASLLMSVLLSIPWR